MRTYFWIAAFAVWSLLLSGILPSYIGSPGIIQLIRLQTMLKNKENQSRQIREDITHMEIEAINLEKNHSAQQREIRKVLGYAAPNELIFDFSNHSQ